ncbi:MAG: polyprenyl synthetase family protein [Lentisphaeria bacterium]|nr:polyprenyl synthetase family protein [Lentisphaeria bacterium]
MEAFKDELRRVGEQIGEFIQNDPFPETVRPPALGDAVRDYPGRGGKRIRPALVLWACELFGGDREQAIPAAAAIEIYHNWTLVHDDIIDRDDLRRGMPSTHVTVRDYAASKLNAAPEQAAFFGESLAILAGDVQQGWAVERLASVADRGVDPALALTLVRAMQTKLNRELISGEARDVEFELLDPSAVSIPDVMSMINGKTGAIMEFALHCGAAIAKGAYEPKSPDFVALSRYAVNLAAAFQLQDDMLGVFGDEKVLGKPICSDFQEAKPTMLFLEAIHHLDAAGRARLDSCLRLPRYTDADVAAIRAILTESGSAETVRNSIAALSACASAALRQLPDNQWRTMLDTLVEQMLVRSV